MKLGVPGCGASSALEGCTCTVYLGLATLAVSALVLAPRHSVLWLAVLGAPWAHSCAAWGAARQWQPAS